MKILRRRVEVAERRRAVANPGGEFQQPPGFVIRRRNQLVHVGHSRRVQRARDRDELEDQSEKSAVSPGRLIPARELLGDMLLENGNAPAALAEYERSQVRDPNRLRALYGAGTAAAQAGDKAKAKGYFARVAALAAGAEGRPELNRAREYLAAN